jgi:DNA-binding NarL/FixJ family response regulator
VAHGLAKKEIAKTMHISVKTVDRHSANLMSKLDIHDRVELTRFAIREGLTDA